MKPIAIRKMESTDWDSVSNIYEEGIATGMATFETKAPSYKAWDDAHMSSCRLVAEEKGTVLGWAALSPVSSRCVYGGVAEVSVYVSINNSQKGIATQLMEFLIKKSEKEGIWTLQSGIFPNNIGSIKLHEKVGFRQIGKRERIGKLNGSWFDNVLFERRSSNVGVD